MRSQKTGRKKSSKRRFFDIKKREKSLTPRTLVVTHQDGSVTRVNPHPDWFDGDYKSLAISKARPKERVSWEII